MTFFLFWSENNISSLPTLGSKPLDKNDYHFCLHRGIDIITKLEKKYTLTAEEEFIFTLVDTEQAFVQLKGYIDVYYTDENGDYHILDYKTSGSIKKNDDFKRQGMTYAILIKKRYGKYPKTASFAYLKQKLNRIVTFIYDTTKPKKLQRDEIFVSVKEVEEFEHYIPRLAQEIISKGYDISKYDIGKLDSPFNRHKIACTEEENKRLYGGNRISMIVKNNLLFFKELPNDLFTLLQKRYTYNHRYYSKESNRYEYFKKTFVINNTLPFAFYPDLCEVIEKFNEVNNTKYTIDLLDMRKPSIVNKVFTSEFTPSEKEPRYYQLDAIDIALKKKYGVLFIGTSGGKTYIISQFIRKTNRRILFIVNNNELLRQTAESYQDELGVNIGMMNEGNLVIDKQITIASIRTLHAILKRDNDESKQLKTYLANVTCTIMDECQNVSDVGMYFTISKYLINNVYMIGLSGSPFRNDGATMGMFSLTGSIIYTKTIKELQDEGFAVPVRTYFIENKCPEFSIEEKDGKELTDIRSMYNENYRVNLIENEDRNKMIVDLVAFFMKQQMKVLVVAKSLEHIDILSQKLPKASVITGQTNKIQRKELYTEFKESTGLLIGQYKIFSAGIDIPDLDVIINCVGNKSLNDVVQMAGRPMRKAPGKTFGYYIDFCDYNNKFLSKASSERKRILKQYGFDVQTLHPDRFR
jgi:superfamily II DNA or RNA helicase